MWWLAGSGAVGGRLVGWGLGVGCGVGGVGFVCGVVGSGEYCGMFAAVVGR